MFKKLIIGVLLLLIVLNVEAQETAKNYKELTREEIVQLSTEELLALPFEDLLYLANKLGVSIDELLSMKTSVASKTNLTPRETPGIISVVTENEIKKSGARDLIDVLRLVPGFDFGNDVGSVVGLGMRGNWVHEGKLLLMVDNQEINDLFYFNNNFGNHFSVQQIKRIEIIRGPGSAMYGGNAELGVINIITKKGEEIDGIEASAAVGQLSKINGRNNYSILAGEKINDWDFSIKGFIGRANRNQEIDFRASDTVNYSKGGSEIKTENLNLGVNNKNLSMRFIYDNYTTEYVDPEWHAISEFKTYLGEIKYKFDVNEKLSVTPLLSYKNTTPYYEEGWNRNVRDARYKANFTVSYKPVESFDLLAGVEYYKDNCWMFEDSVGAFFIYDTTKNDVIFSNSSLFIQGVYKWNKINFIAGARAEHHDYYGNAYAPRFGITGIFNDFHSKLLYSRAFRAPGIGNIDVSQNLKTEYTDVLELELGYKINSNNFLTANIYDITIHRPIVYFDNGGDANPIADWGYHNADKSGSRGIELEYRSMYNWGSLTFNYSYYTVSNKNIPELYSIPGNKEQVLAFSPNKIGFLGIFQITNDISLSPSVSLNGERYSYAGVEGFPDSLAVKKFDPYMLINLNFLYSNMLVKGLDVSLGVFDLLNKKPSFLQPYNGGRTPYPGRSREIVATLTYRFKLK